MNGKTKMTLGIALIVGIIALAFLAAPIQAYINGTGSGDLLQTQERERIRARDCECDGDMLQTQERERLRTQTRDCDGYRTQTQSRCRQRVNECAMNRTCNCTMSLEQYRYRYRNQDRERTGNPVN